MNPDSKCFYLIKLPKSLSNPGPRTRSGFMNFINGSGSQQNHRNPTGSVFATNYSPKPCLVFSTISSEQVVANCLRYTRPVLYWELVEQKILL